MANAGQTAGGHPAIRAAAGGNDRLGGWKGVSEVLRKGWGWEGVSETLRKGQGREEQARECEAGAGQGQG